MGGWWGRGETGTIGYTLPKRAGSVVRTLFSLAPHFSFGTGQSWPWQCALLLLRADPAALDMTRLSVSSKYVSTAPCQENLRAHAWGH